MVFALAHQTVTRFRDGALSPARGPALDFVNPADESLAGTLHEADAAEVAAAVDSAEKAFRTGSWPGLSAAERKHVFRRIADVVLTNLDDPASLETASTGQPIGSSRFRQFPPILPNFIISHQWPNYDLATTAQRHGA